MSTRAILLTFTLTLATLLCGCQSATPVKIPLTTTAIPDGTRYQPSSIALSASTDPGWFRLTQENPTTKLTLGGIECLVKAEMPYKPNGQAPGTTLVVPGKLFFKTSTQEFTFDLPGDRTKLMELTFDNGRKYLLWGEGVTFAVVDSETKRQGVFITCQFWPVGIQTGKIGQFPIAIFDSNLDGFYTTSEDGIVVGSLTEFSDGFSTTKYHLVQPFSKYISTPNGIFEIKNLTKDGTELTLLPYTGPTASLEVIAPPNCSGQIILTSDTGLNVTVNGKAVGGGESVTVIPGNYTILAAKLTPAPRDSQQRSVWMTVSGAGMPPLKLKPGTKQSLILSGPKTLDLQATLLDGNVNIKPDSIFRIKGHAGETYSYMNYDQPEVYLNVDGKSTRLKMEFLFEKIEFG